MAEKSYYVVSHSNIMQCGLAILELQQKVKKGSLAETKGNFDFGQNAWTLELCVENNDLLVEDLHDGVPKPKHNTKKNDHKNIRLVNAPSTVPYENKECKFDTAATDFLNTLPNQNRVLVDNEPSDAPVQESDLENLMEENDDDDDDDDDDEGASRVRGIENSTMIGGRMFPKIQMPQIMTYVPLHKFVKMKKPCFSSPEARATLGRSVVRYKNRKSPPPGLIFSDNANGSRIFISRHANSCNNITDDLFGLRYKKQDPSLSDLGVWSLDPKSLDDKNKPIRPAALTMLAKKRVEIGSPAFGDAENPVYVSSCIRTWMTACMIYKVPGQLLNLIISPFLKEKGPYSGNLPENLDKQRSKINAWMKRNLKDQEVKIYLADVSGKLVLIYNADPEFWYKRAEGEKYDKEHKTYYKDGIQKFCKWLTSSPEERMQMIKPSMQMPMFSSLTKRLPSMPFMTRSAPVAQTAGRFRTIYRKKRRRAKKSIRKHRVSRRR